ncbi:MAG: helix-turn-helix transcriptional regulator [Polyangiaceae bacterium]|nr:helix-turn-helix transcriptional regulator [Polyangiaceae bacterium]
MTTRIPSFALRLGLRLRGLRQEADLSAEVLASRIPGMTPGQLRRFEEGYDIPSLIVARQLGEALGIDLPTFVDVDAQRNHPMARQLLNRLSHCHPEQRIFLHRVLFTLLQGLDEGTPFDPNTPPVKPALKLLPHP